MAFRIPQFLGNGLKSPRPPYEGAYIYILLFFVGMLISDFSTTYSRSKMLPVGGITKSSSLRGRGARKKNTASIWKSLRDSNIFNSDHVLAPTLAEKTKGSAGEPGKDAAPVLSSLPLKLIGTIIHGAREKSVATIEVNNKDIQAVVADDEIDGMAKIFQIDRYKVIFRNLRSRRLEYIEIKEENAIKMGISKGTSAPTMEAPEEPTNFTFKRMEINKYLENLPKVLQDAKAVEYKAPGSNEVSGFKLVAIKAGSIYETLGLRRGDIIKGVNGEPVDTAQKAMELYQALKNSDNIQLDVTRDGSSKSLNYTLE